MATSRVDVVVNKPGQKMQRGLQGLLSTGQVVTVLTCQPASAMLHAVRRRWPSFICRHPAALCLDGRSFYICCCARDALPAQTVAI